MTKRYSLGEFAVDSDTLTLTRAGGPVHLTRKPFQVLLYLVEHRNRMVTRQELLEQFWQGRDVYDETLTKTVGAIRKALEDQRQPPRYIVTHWAEGYRYIGPVAEDTIGPPSSPAGDETTPLTPSPPPAPGRGRSRAVWLSLTGLLLLAVAVTGSYLYRPRLTPAVATPEPVRSIAILPLRNLGTDPDDQYFSDGLTESLISALSRIRDLKVIARGSAFSVQAQGMDARAVGRALGVASVLEGSVRKDGDLIRLNMRLVATRDGAVIWTNDTHNRALGDLFAIQDEIASLVAARLRVAIGGPRNPLASNHTDNIEAYQLYLKGRYLWNQRTAHSLLKAIDYFNQALAADPGYALAYAGLADCYNVLTYFAKTGATETFTQAKVAALKALEIDDSLAEAHASLGLTRFGFDWDATGAEREYRRAIDLNPNYATGHHWYGLYLSIVGRHDEAIAELARAHELDPLSLIIGCDQGAVLLAARRYDEAAARLRDTLELSPDFAPAHAILGMLYREQGRFPEAIAALEKAVSLDRSPMSLGLLGHAYAQAGNKANARNMLAALTEHRPDQKVPPVWVAAIYSGLGQKDAAFRWLERAYQDRDGQAVALNGLRVFDDIHADPRFARLVQRIGIAPADAQ